MSRHRVLRLALLGLGTLLGCSGPPAAGTTPPCVPGPVETCVCEDGASGTRVCGADLEPGDCDCTEEGLGLPADPTGAAQYLLDFGTLAVGDRAEEALPLRNGSTETVTYEARRVEPPFGVETSLQLQLSPGETGALRWSFAPVAAGPFEAVAEIATTRGIPTVRLTGRGFWTRLSCEPSRLDFGETLTGRMHARGVVCTNTGDTPWTLVAGPITGADANAFDALVTDPGSRPPGGTWRLEVTHRPERTGPHAAVLPLASDAGVAAGRVALAASAVPGHFVCAPNTLDFAYVPPGTTRHLDLVCRNGTHAPVEVTGLRFDDSSSAGFGVFAPWPLVVPPRVDGVEGQATIDVSFTAAPEGAGVRDGLLLVLTEMPEFPRVDVRTHAFSGPPCDVAIEPPALDFGDVDKGTSKTVSFSIRNQSHDVACSVGAVRLAPTCASAYSLPEGDLAWATVPPGGEVLVPVRFAPVSYQTAPFTCTATLDVSDEDSPVRTVPIQGLSHER